jgi:hypothetical protein
MARPVEHDLHRAVATGAREKRLAAAVIADANALDPAEHVAGAAKLFLPEPGPVDELTLAEVPPLLEFLQAGGTADAVTSSGASSTIDFLRESSTSSVSLVTT